jgi:hypothetical protein
MSSQIAVSHCGWSGRGRSEDRIGDWAPLTATSEGWSSPVTRISIVLFIGNRPSPW